MSVSEQRVSAHREVIAARGAVRERWLPLPDLGMRTTRGTQPFRVTDGFCGGGRTA